MKINFNKGFRRICLVVSSFILLFFLVTEWPDYWTYVDRAPDPDNVAIRWSKIPVEEAIQEITAANPGITREKASDFVREIIERGKQQQAARNVPLYNRIHWYSILVSALLVAVPWMVYGVGVYIGKGFNQSPTS